MFKGNKEPIKLLIIIIITGDEAVDSRTRFGWLGSLLEGQAPVGAICADSR